MSSCFLPRSCCATNAAEAALDFACGVRLDAELFALLEACGFTAAERRRGCQLALDAATAALEVRCHDGDTLIEAEGRIETWALLAFRRLERKLAPDFPEEHAFLVDGLEPGWGIAAVPVAKALLRRVRTLRALAGDRTPVERRIRDALAELERREFRIDEVARVEDLIERVEWAASLVYRETSSSPEEKRVREWLNLWVTIAIDAVEAWEEAEVPSSRHPGRAA